MDSPSITAQAERPYISTGHLPESEMVQELVSEAQRRFKSNTDGQNSQVYPALARIPSNLFGVCVVDQAGMAKLELPSKSVLPSIGPLGSFFPLFSFPAY